MNKDMLKRIATIKTSEVENKLPRIHIKNEGSLFQLMVWRNKNKDKVRNIRPIVKEGIISVGMKSNYFYFLQNDDEVYISQKASNKEYVAFIYDIKKYTTLPIANNITFYPKDEVIQDIITTYASTMAYLNEVDAASIKEGEIVVIDKIT
jgi:hypothetical protein